MARSRTLGELVIRKHAEQSVPLQLRYPAAPTCKNRGMGRSWIRLAANGITLRCAAGPGGTRTSPAHGVRGWCTLGRETSIQKVEWDRATVGRTWSAAMGESVTSKPRSRRHRRPRPLRIIASMTSSISNDTSDLNWNTLRVPFDGETMGQRGRRRRWTLRGQGLAVQTCFELSLVGTPLAGVRFQRRNQGDIRSKQLHARWPA